MSSIAMAADSTQSELKDGLKGKKHKKNASKKRKVKAVKKRRSDDESNSDCDSDMDLNKELKPIGGYLHDRELTVEHMFRSISGKKLKAMLPEILKFFPASRRSSLDVAQSEGRGNDKARATRHAVDVFDPIPVNELKKLCIEQLECMSKKRIRRILEGADPDTISSTGTEEDSSLSDSDKHKDDGSEHTPRSDTLANSPDQKEERNIPDVTTHSDTSRSPESFVSRSRSRSRSPLSSRSASPEYGSDHSVASPQQLLKHDQSSDGGSQRYTEQSDPEESSTEELVEEVVYEEVVLEDGDDLESILGHGSFLKGTRDSRLRTVSSHKQDVNEEEDVMMIEREEREDQSDGDRRQSMATSEGGDSSMLTSASVEQNEEPKLEDVQPTGIGEESVTSTLKDFSVSPSDMSMSESFGPKTGEGDQAEPSLKPIELEEGEIEDSSSGDEETATKVTEEDSTSEHLTDKEQLQHKCKPTPNEATKVKGKAAPRKKKVRVIKRIIKVIRKKPKSEGQSTSPAFREPAKKLKVSHQSQQRHDSDLSDDCKNVRTKSDQGPEQPTLVSRPTVQARVKTERSLPEVGDLTSVSEKSLNQMEILELEMRARAIKAMLKKQEEKEKHENPDVKRKIKLKRKLTES